MVVSSNVPKWCSIGPGRPRLVLMLGSELWVSRMRPLWLTLFSSGRWESRPGVVRLVRLVFAGVRCLQTPVGDLTPRE